MSPAEIGGHIFHRGRFMGRGFLLTQRQLAEPVATVLPGDLASLRNRDDDLPVDQHVHAVAGLALRHDLIPCVEGHHRGFLRQLLPSR